MDEPIVDPGFDEEEELDEFMDDDEDVWDEDEEWLMALVTPPRATVTVPSTYEVGGPSTATPVGHLLTTMTSRVATHEELVKKMVKVSDAKVPDSITIWEIHPRVATVEGQLRTRVPEMESREGTLMSYMLWMEERLTVLEKRLPGLPSGP
ncbi:hypothetical protein Tco_0541145 [Tanacetum coccineum]